MALAEAGATSRSQRAADKLAQTRQAVEAVGRQVLVVPTDVADPEACQRLVDATMVEFGRVDILVNNAGVGTSYPATRETPEQFRQVIDINLNGCYWMAQACGRVRLPGSSIVNVNSVLGMTTAGLPQAAYFVSKAGLIGLTRDLAPPRPVEPDDRVPSPYPRYNVFATSDRWCGSRRLQRGASTRESHQLLLTSRHPRNEPTPCGGNRRSRRGLRQLAGSKVIGRCSKPRKKGLGRRVGLPSTFRF